MLLKYPMFHQVGNISKNDREFNQFAKIAIPPRIQKQTHNKSKPENMLEVEEDLKPYEHINI